ncbi:MAG: septum formation initiator family protein [Caulobacteraceae bacterium]
MLDRIRPYAPIAILALLIFYFGFQALTGDRGLLNWTRQDELLAAKAAELKQVHRERMELEARARLLRDGTLSRDLLEERARSLLGLSDPRDYVIRTKPVRAG